MKRIASELKAKAGQAKLKIRGWAEKTQTDVQSRLDAVTEELSETGRLLEEKGQLLKEKSQLLKEKGALLKEKSAVLQQIVGGVLQRVEDIRKADWLPDAVRTAQKIVEDLGKVAAKSGKKKKKVSKKSPKVASKSPAKKKARRRKAK